jgi:hypothetical protein
VGWSPVVQGDVRHHLFKTNRARVMPLLHLLQHFDQEIIEEITSFTRTISALPLLQRVRFSRCSTSLRAYYGAYLAPTAVTDTDA